MKVSGEINLISLFDCTYHQHGKSDKLCFNEISISGETYTLDDYFVMKTENDIEIASFTCIYLPDDQKTVYAVLRKFILARNEEILFVKHGFDFDQYNEVVEDLCDHCVELNSIANAIVKKCNLLLLTEDEDPSSFMQMNRLDPDVTFICRFSMKSQSLFPNFPTKQTILGEKSPKSPIVTQKSEKSADQMAIEITPSTYIKDTKKSCKEQDLFPSPQRNSVRRNLNKSFGNSPQDHNKSILNYSVVTISDDEDDDHINYSIVSNSDNENGNPLVMKLRVSNDKNISTTNVSNKIGIEISPKLRKSRRNIERKSYVDYVSPLKNTPTKRLRNSSLDEEFVPKSAKVARDTPKKTPSRNVRNEVIRSSKRNKVTPLRYVDELAASYGHGRSTPARRQLRLSHAEEPKITRNLRSCQGLKVCNNEDDMDKHNSSEVDLKNSIQRLLKIKLSRLDPVAEQIIRETPNCEVEFIESEDEGCKLPKDKFVPKTPKSKRKPSKAIDTDSDGDTPPITPKTRRGASVAKSSNEASPKRPAAKPTPKCTPNNRAKLIREGIVTPSMHARSKKVNGVSTPLMKARTQLHVSYVPDSMPCREKEYCDVWNFVEGKLLDKCGGCMYISGVPGTGKTATVTSVINNLLESDDVLKFSFVNINGMRLTEPRQAYVEILKQLQGKSVPWEQAQSMLDDIFGKSKKMNPVVMLIDELDVLCTKRQDVVYNLLDWPTKAKNQLIVITIANTMDLPERLLMSRVTSRLGLTRLTFNAYTHKQLQEIVTRRLCGTDSFNPDAVQFVARKVASVSGDARRALDICRRAAEIAESEGKGQLVNMNHVNEALNAMITQPKIRAIKHCSRLEQLIMQSIVAEVERTGVEETTFADVFKMFETCAAIEGFKIVSTTVALSAVARLSACRLILTDHKSSDIYQRIILNVSVDDVYYALKKN